MGFIKFSQYTRDEIWQNYYPNQGHKPKGGNWDTGYVREGGELIAFLNIDAKGRTGHDFQNSFDTETEQLVWFGKTNSHSEQPLFKRLIAKELTPHFFARWDSSNPKFTYLGTGDVINFKDNIEIEAGKFAIELLIQLTNNPNSIGDEGVVNPDSDRIPYFGKKVSTIINRFERDPYKRILCLEHFGYKCQICDFCFLEKYGEIGKEFCHVHHIEPLSEVGGERDIDPTKDLIPVCANCHAIIHRKKPALKPEELRALLNSK
jgi:5-methylcytosine-specific restriction protein A